ncbi:flagellin lysine-N-methylase [Gulbenkiania mobilis]|uniref:Lysine-N-methylase n=1 Tax=Gulbenkiania mobilis TaxID=397457 RepID=A0ABY2D0A8_GULMO|nr:hypothetical protein EV669_10139 [Gulbenkiania mobilis]
MSVTRHLEVIAPAYLEKFSCLGPTCPDTCCYGWQVPVEHESYLKLMRLQDDPLKPLVKQALVRGPGKPGSDNFGMLKLGATREQPCALLSESGLCQLHATHGETMLPDVCSSYPRASKAVDGVMDQFASPSCPEVARLLVEDVDALDLRTSQQPVRKYVEFRTTSMTPETMERLRSFFLGCMGATQLPVWQRLALQLLVAEAVEGCTGLDTSKDAQIGAVLDEWEGLLATGEALALLQDLPRHDLLHLKVLAAASRIRAELPFNRTRYLELLEEALQSLGVREDGGGAEADALVCERFAGTALTWEIDQALGRVLLNHCYTQHYPLGMPAGKMVRVVVLHYLMLRFAAVGLTSARGRPLSHAELTELVYLFYRAQVHVPEYLSRCMAAFEGHGLQRTEHWLLLLPAEIFSEKP